MNTDRLPIDPRESESSNPCGVDPRSVLVWDVPFSPVTFVETLAAIGDMIARRRPHFLITANLHYVMLSASDERLRRNNDRAALILADGMPIVWASRWRERRLPERVTGSDLFPMLCERAAEKGWRLFFLGSAPGVGDEAARRLREKHPSIQIVGVESPPFRDATPEEHAALLERLRAARPDVLFVAFGQPKGEYWVADHYEQLGIPVVMQVGATIDFAAGRVTRAPKWMQKIGMEWSYRFLVEPRRMFGRYWSNGWFAIRKLLGDVFTRRSLRR